MTFSCERCGSCCINRYLCIYFFEKDILLQNKKKNKLEFELLPFRYYLDLTNKIIITIIYRVDLKPCPFFKSKCIIQSEKFISCKKYPLNTCIDLGFFSLIGFNRYYFDLDKNCTFIKNDKNFASSLKNNKIEKVFDKEFKANIKDQDIWSKYNKKLKKLKKLKNFEIIVDFKARKKDPEKHIQYQKAWKNLNFDEYWNIYGFNDQA